MKHIIRISAVLLFCTASLASCKKEFDYRFAEKGPEVTVNSVSQSAYMGGDISFSVSLSDAEFDLSTLKARLYFDEDMVSEAVVRTTENGTYLGTVSVPLMAGIPDGTATVVFTGENVGQGKTTTEPFTVSVKRPDFQTLTLKIGSDEYPMQKVAPYKYEAVGNFPAEANGYIVTPAIDDNGTVISLGWGDSGIELYEESADNLIPFSNTKAGMYTISVDLMTLSAAPFGKLQVNVSETSPSVQYLTQGSTVEFPNIADAASWDLDPDYFKLQDDNSVTFLPIDGLYRITAMPESKYFVVDAMADEDNTAVLNQDGTGALWLVGGGVGKPAYNTASWSFEKGRCCLAQIEPKKFQVILSGGGSITDAAEFNIMTALDWSAKMTEDVLTINSDMFEFAANGNMKLASGKKVKTGQYYKFTVDLTAGNDKAVFSVEEIEAPVSVLDISFAGMKANRGSADNYIVSSIDLTQGQEIAITGVDNLSEWYIDPDYFSRDAGKIKFNATDGKYYVELHPVSGYISLKKLKADGSEATLGEGALWMLGWGVANPVMTKQIGFDEKTAYCLAEVRPLVFQFTGEAVEEKDGTTLGGRVRYDYISAKYFAQNAWGNECGKIFGSDTKVQLSGNCANLMKITTDANNIELLDPDAVTLELGATYRLTIDLTKAESEGVEIIAFDKL